MVNGRYLDRQDLLSHDYQEIGVKSPLWQNVNDTIMQARKPLKISSMEFDVSCCTGEVFAGPLL